MLISRLPIDVSAFNPDKTEEIGKILLIRALRVSQVISGSIRLSIDFSLVSNLVRLGSQFPEQSAFSLEILGHTRGWEGPLDKASEASSNKISLNLCKALFGENHCPFRFDAL